MAKNQLKLTDLKNDANRHVNGKSLRQPPITQVISHLEQKNRKYELKLESLNREIELLEKNRTRDTVKVPVSGTIENVGVKEGFFIDSVESAIFIIRPCSLCESVNDGAN